MQKVYALIAAFVVFFSAVGGVLGASICECPEMDISQKYSLSAPVLEQASTAPSLTLAKKVPLQGQDVASHDCHFGHCGFILNIRPILSSPVSHSEAMFFGLHASFSSGFRSETLRPPSRA